MDPTIRQYLAEIGRRGGRKSRRTLDPEQARAMVREARGPGGLGEGSPAVPLTALQARVATAFADDLDALRRGGCTVETEISQPGYIRAIVRLDQAATKIEWAKDSAWRFMPVIRSEQFGYQLHPMDLATNKILALAGRDEPRDLLNAVHLHEHVLSLGALVWASVGKDPGFSPPSLLELLGRRGKLRPEDLARLDLAAPVDPAHLKATWAGAVEQAAAFIAGRPVEEAGCLYYSASAQSFVTPGPDGPADATPHFGRPLGVLPRLID